MSQVNLLQFCGQPTLHLSSLPFSSGIWVLIFITYQPHSSRMFQTNTWNSQDKLTSMLPNWIIRPNSYPRLYVHDHFWLAVDLSSRPLFSRGACSWPFPPHYCYTLQTIAFRYCTSCMCNAGGTVSVINDESHFIWELSACEKVEIAPVRQNRSALKPMKIMRENLMPRPTYTRREENHNVYWWLLKWQTKCVYSSAKESVYILVTVNYIEVGTICRLSSKISIPLY